jgi:hypothetical protein
MSSTWKFEPDGLATEAESAMPEFSPTGPLGKRSKFPEGKCSGGRQPGVVACHWLTKDEGGK